MNKYKSSLIQIFSLYLFLISCLLLISCGNQSDTDNKVNFGIPLTEIHLDEISTDRNAEISGLTWYSDELIILPQYPDRFQINNFGTIFKISKKEIIKYLNDQSTAMLTAEKIEFDDQSIVNQIPRFQGYEAIIFIDNQVYLSVESRVAGKMNSFLVSGTISKDTKKIQLNSNSIKQLELPAQIRNMSFETLIRVDDKIVAIFEMNGANVNANPVALLIDPVSNQINEIPFPVTEYRITDASAVNSDNHFWAINYYWPGDFDISDPAKDLLLSNQKNPPTFNKNRPIERIVKLKYSESGIEHTTANPIYLTHEGLESGRNWEGIVKLDDRGFLIVTDKHPGTILAFVSF